MKKVLSICLFLFLLGGLLTATVSADSSRIRDEVGVLSKTQLQSLNATLEQYSEELDVQLYAVITDNVGWREMPSYADRLYEFEAYDADGALLLISVSDRYWYVSTCGRAVNAIGDPDDNGLAERYFLSDLSYGDYAAAVEGFCAMCRDQMTVGTTDWAIRIGACLIIGLIVALIVTGVWKRQLKTVRFQTAANQYVRAGSLNVTRSGDLFLYHTVTRTARPQSNPSGSHHSSSGVSHGGGGGRF